MDSELSEEVTRGIYQAMFSLSARDRFTAVWVMSPEWAQDVRHLKDSSGLYLWMPSFTPDGPDLLLGKPIHIKDDAGFPRMEQPSPDTSE